MRSGHASAKASSLAAPQAMLIKSVAEGVFTGNLPWTLVFIGMAVAVIIIMIDLHLGKIGSSFRMPILAVAIGFYLPFELAPPILVGGFIHHALQKYYKKRSLSSEEPMRRGLLFSSGLITGEALVGIMMAIPIVIAKRDDVLAVCDGMLGQVTGEMVGITVFTAIAIWLYKSAMPSNK